MCRKNILTFNRIKLNVWIKSYILIKYKIAFRCTLSLVSFHKLKLCNFLYFIATDRMLLWHARHVVVVYIHCVSIILIATEICYSDHVNSSRLEIFKRPLSQEFNHSPHPPTYKMRKPFEGWHVTVFSPEAPPLPHLETWTN